MRGFAAYMLGGALAVAAMNFVAPALGVGLSSWPQANVSTPNVVAPAALIQQVNRTHKGDRLDAPATTSLPENANGREPPTPLPDGCEAPVSPLSASAQATNVAHRCIS